jgi:type II secretory pathway component PulF
MNAEELILLNEEIAGMARAGLPLDQGLAAMAREMGKGRLQRVTADIAADLRAGHTLPEALDRQAGRVPPFYAGLVAAGVRSGRISEVLATLTVYARSLADLRATVVSAMIYPAVVLVFGLALFGFLSFFIIPQFQVIFRDFDMQLPFLTELVIEISQHALVYLVLPLLAIVGVLILVRLILTTREGGRRAWARFVYAIPIAGTLIRSTRLAAFTELLAILVDHELPLPEAFRLAGEASSDPIMATASRQVQHDLSQGLPLGEVLRSRRLVPELIAWMTGLGEQRGTLGKTLHQVAEIYRRQAEMRAALLRSVLPPFLIIGTAGVLAGIFVMVILLPMLKLIEGLSK